MFKNENGFSLVELAIAAGLAVALAATAVTILSGTTANLSSKANGAAGTSTTYNSDVLANASGAVSAPAAPAVTLAPITSLMYNNGTVLWSPVNASEGDVRFVLTVTSTGAPIADVLASEATVGNFTWNGSFQYNTGMNLYAIGAQGHAYDITITATSVANPAVSVSYSG